jgi:pyruvate formate lyase activating enzyme
VTLSGGEPLYQPHFTLNLLKACHSIHAHTAVETSGFASEATTEAVAPFVDLFLYDIKHMDPVQHRKLTGVDNRPIHRNLRRLVELGKDIQIRVPLIPGCNDDHQNIEATYRFTLSLGIGKLALLPYNVAAGSKYEWMGRPYAINAPVLQSEERLASLRSLGESLGLAIQIGG